MNEELINKIITYNYNNFGNEFGDALVDLQKENARLKDKIKKSFKIVDDKLTNLNLEYGVNNEFREEYDELWEILKEN